MSWPQKLSRDKRGESHGRSLMNRIPTHSFPGYRHAATGLAAFAALTSVALAGAVSAQAKVVFPTPGAMTFTDLPSQVRAGHTFTLHELMPYAILSGDVLLQSQSPAGAWQTLASAPPAPHIFWMHWRVPAALGGSQLTVRFLLENKGNTMAVSPNYAMDVTATARTNGAHQ
jgi:hypothetical protein